MPPTADARFAASKRCGRRSRKSSSRCCAGSRMPVEEASPAIVLRTRDYSESDRIVTLLTREFGKLSGIAKGAKVSRRRFERKLEVFSHVMLYFRRRPRGELVFITKAEAGELTPFEMTDDLGK